MIYVIKFKDGLHSREVQVDECNESMALARLFMLCPTAKLISVKPIGVEE